jgi:hypothetical protein
MGERHDYQTDEQDEIDQDGPDTHSSFIAVASHELDERVDEYDCEQHGPGCTEYREEETRSALGYCW